MRPRHAGPYDPPRQLVVAGLYRYVHNPQYVGVVLVVVGEALLSGRLILFGYAALLAIGYHLFVTHYEEPTLGRLFGEPYARYRPDRPSMAAEAARPNQPLHRTGPHVDARSRDHAFPAIGLLPTS